MREYIKYISAGCGTELNRVLAFDQKLYVSKKCINDVPERVLWRNRVLILFASHFFLYSKRLNFGPIWDELSKCNYCALMPL